MDVPTVAISLLGSLLTGGFGGVVYTQWAEARREDKRNARTEADAMETVVSTLVGHAQRMLSQATMAARDPIIGATLSPPENLAVNDEQRGKLIATASGVAVIEAYDQCHDAYEGHSPISINSDLPGLRHANDDLVLAAKTWRAAQPKL
jgi:hypothetical protein